MVHYYGCLFIALILLIQVLKYLSITEEDDMPWVLIQAVCSSVAQTAVIPLQDILGLGNSARMNVPATQVKKQLDRWLDALGFHRLHDCCSLLNIACRDPTGKSLGSMLPVFHSCTLPLLDLDILYSIVLQLHAPILKFV